MAATVQWVVASTLADRGLLSIAASSPKIPPA